MADPPDILQDERLTTVPWAFRTRLRRILRIAKENYYDARKPLSDRIGTSNEVANINGHVHPHPYTYAEAVACVERRLKHMTDEGWQIVTLRVMASGEND